MGSNQETWRDLVASKQQALDKTFPAPWRLDDGLKNAAAKDGRLLEADTTRRSGILSEDELDITEHYSASQLLQKLARGEVSSLAVVTAFCKRAAIAQQLTSCLTEHFFDSAFARAKHLDEYLRREGRPVGPLHGLPISIKDSFCVQGVQSSVGYVSFLKDPPATANSALVNILLEQGAVLYVKTNVPQTMMTGDSENNIFGRTLNPNNTNLTAGGSSGGEGALVAFRGSILGIGTDIAGSIRIPALCNGVYGFKPTNDRIPFGGQVSGAMEGLPGLKPAAGPLAQSLGDMTLLMSAVLGAKPYRHDVTAHAVPWQPVNIQGPLTVGILPEDAQFPLHPPVRRALESAVSALESSGHKVVRLARKESTSVAYGSRLAFQYFTYGPHVDHIASSGEPVVCSVAKASHPMFTGPFPVDTQLDTFAKINALHEARMKYQQDWSRIWFDNDLDVIVGPGSQCTAVRHDTYGWPPYTVLWNLLDYPSCIIPYSSASKFLDPHPMTVDDAVQPQYNPVDVDGAPCAIQVTAFRFLDEQCLAAATVIDQELHGHK